MIKVNKHARDIDGKCCKCKGTGTAPYAYMNGECFDCGGMGSVEKFKKHAARKNAEESEKTAVEHDGEIASLKIRIEELTVDGKPKPMAMALQKRLDKLLQEAHK